MVKALTPDQAFAVAPYKLAFTIAKYKMPFNKCDPIVEFARSADPQSKVFSHMASSRKTITTKTVELHEKVLKPELKRLVEQSPFWLLIVDESSDSAMQEQMTMYVRCIDLEERCVATKISAVRANKRPPRCS